MRARGSAIVALATAGAAYGFMKSSWGMLVLLLVYGLAMGVASNTVKWSGVRALVRYAPPLTEMARCRFRGLAYGRGEPTRVNGLGPALFVVAPWGCWAQGLPVFEKVTIPVHVVRFGVRLAVCRRRE